MSETALDVRNVSKSYGTKRAVDGISLSVPPGEIFGLLGPNGAGKTSLLRMIMDIVRPDEGEIRLLGHPISPSLKNRLGYLPEERGLYQRQKVGDVLRFLGELKGLASHVATQRAERTLDRVGLLETKNKRMRELSKGMQQKVQIAAVLLHEPELVFLDEPFIGLDPLNRNLVIEIMKEASARGTTVVLSSHLMEQVEALCRRVFLIQHGRCVLEGEVRTILESHADNSVWIELEGEIPSHASIERTESRDGRSRVWIRHGTTPEQFLSELIRAGARIRHYERALPTLDEVFVKVAS